MLRSFRARFGVDYDRFADLHAVQLNDTHPTMAIPELIRLLMADGVTFNRAFRIAQRTFRYTNHTVMREALEVWDVSLLNDVSPALVRIVKRIQTRLAAELRKKGVRGHGRAGHRPRRARCTWRTSPSTAPRTPTASPRSTPRFSSARSSASGTRLIPERFNNKTNGITQRRWLGLCNPELCALLDGVIGSGYLTDLSRLRALDEKIDDALASRFIAVKREKKRQLAALIREREGID